MTETGTVVRNERAPCECPCGCARRGCTRHVTAERCWPCSTGVHHTWEMTTPEMAEIIRAQFSDGTVWVTLSDADVAYATDTAARVTANYQSLAKRGTNQLFDPEKDARNPHAFGAELAVARWLAEQGRGGHWNEGDPLRADVDMDIQVRNSEYMDAPLWIYMPDGRRKGDRPDHRFVLAPGRLPAFRIVGWLTGRDCMQDEWRVTRGQTVFFDNGARTRAMTNAFVVPQSSLRPVRDLA